MSADGPQTRVTDDGATPASPLTAAWDAAISMLRRASLQHADPRALSGGAAALIAPLRGEPRFAWLHDTFALDDRDAACLAVCVAVELDRELGRTLAPRCQDAQAGHPDLSSLQRLLCATLDDRVALQARFAWDAPLFRHRLLQPLEATARMPDPPRQAMLAVDPQILRTLCYGEWLDPRLARYCRILVPQAHAPELPAAVVGVDDALSAAIARREPLTLLFVGQPGSGRRDAALQLAARFDAKLLVADLSLAHALGDFLELTTPLLREAWLQGAWLYLEGIEALFEAAPADLQRFLDELGEDGGVCIITSAQALAFAGRLPLAPLSIEFDHGSHAQARAAWDRAATGTALVSEQELDMLAARYRLPPARIRAAAAHAAHLARQRRGADASVLVGDLVRASRAQGPSGLSRLARKIEPAHRWEHLVLPGDAHRQMREICSRVEHALQVFEDWGFGPRMSLGKGTSALFVGASGTGKTMAAEVIASELELDLYKIDLATVVSKYIGETEKNLDRVFTAAHYANAVLLFDEADALFGKRSEVRDAHDRYANLEVAYLLQKMEEYEGLSILATNLKQNLDEAFLRRLTYTVLFPFPAAAEREEIWRKTCPAGLPLADDVDFGALARQFKLSGGNIRNALLAAAFFAAADGERVGMRHLVHAVRRELQKAGKSVGEIDAKTLQPVAPVAEAVLRYG